MSPHWGRATEGSRAQSDPGSPARSACCWHRKLGPPEARTRAGLDLRSRHSRANPLPPRVLCPLEGPVERQMSAGCPILSTRTFHELLPRTPVLLLGGVFPSPEEGHQLSRQAQHGSCSLLLPARGVCACLPLPANGRAASAPAPGYHRS